VSAPTTRSGIRAKICELVALRLLPIFNEREFVPSGEFDVVDWAAAIAVILRLGELSHGEVACGW
jgi:hypothetical protein